MSHLLTVGQTGSGKNALLHSMMLAIIAREIVLGRQACMTVAFPHEPWALSLLAELYARFGLRWVLEHVRVDRLRECDKVLCRQYARVSHETDLWRKMQENADFLSSILAQIGSLRKDLRDWSDHPVLENGSRIPHMVAQNVKERQWFPDSWIPFILEKGPVRDFFHRHCTDPKLRAEVMRWNFYNLRDELNLLVPPARLLRKFYGAPQIIARTSRKPTWDKVKFLNNCGILIKIGAGVAEEVVTIDFESDFEETMFLKKKGAITKRVYYIKDEVNRYALAKHNTAGQLATMRYTDTNIWLLAQHLRFSGEPELTEEILQNTDHIWGRINDPDLADKAARDLRGAMDEHKVHHRDAVTRQVHVGTKRDEIPTENVTTDELGRKRVTEGKSILSSPIYEEKTDYRPVYQAGNEQAFWRAADLQEQGPGTFWFRLVGQRPYQQYVPMVADSWVFPGVAAKKAEQCIELLKTLDDYQAPVLLPLPAEEPQTNGKPAGAATRLGANGTNGRTNGSKRTRQPRGKR